MTEHIATLNAFIEDTCVIIVFAYLLARGRALSMLFGPRRKPAEIAVLGLLLGLIGLTEVVFPGARYPYVTHTLIATFAALNCGGRVGLTVAAVISVGSLAIHRSDALAVILGLCASVAIGVAVRRAARGTNSVLAGLVAGMLAQVAALAARMVLVARTGSSASILHYAASIPANGLGMTLLQMVLNDARLRADSERHRLEAERAKTLLAEAELTALRARVHPHFLYNTLTSIAALCPIAADKAQDAIVRLGQLMRRSLEPHAQSTATLADEVTHGRGYVEIEQHRLGDRLTVEWIVNPNVESAMCPPFAVQMLIENAILHGIGPKMEAGTVRVFMKRVGRRVLVAISDDGVGMNASARSSATELRPDRAHGLRLIDQQLVLLYGRSARLRIFSKPDCGTLTAFAVPMPAALAERRVA